MQVDDGTALPANSSVIIDNGAMLNLHQNSFTLASVTLNDGTIESIPSGGTLDVTGLVELGSGIISANLTGPAMLLKSPGVGGTPADTVTLSGDNNYWGTMIVSEGTLMLGGSQQVSQGLSDASSLIVNGGTLDLNGFGTLAFPVAVRSVTMTSAAARS